MRILIIDDDPAIRLLVSATLEQIHGFDVVSACDGYQGLALARAEAFDLILLDHSMPDFPGPAVLKELRKSPVAKQSPIAFFTAKTSDESVAALRALGVADVIGKPFNPDELSARVRRILRDCGKLDRPSGASPSASLTARLTSEFLSDGLRESDVLLPMTDDPAAFERTDAEQIAHRWVGRGGTFGYSNISELARQIKIDIGRFPDNTPRFVASVQAIRLLFAGEPPARRNHQNHETFERAVCPPTRDIVERVKKVLAGARIASVGFDQGDNRRLVSTLEDAGAFVRALIPAESTGLNPEELKHFDLMVQRVHETTSEEYPFERREHDTRTLYVGSPDAVSLSAGLAHGDDVVVCPVTPDELLLRAYRLLSVDEGKRTGGSSDNRMILIADDDPTVTALLAIHAQELRVRVSRGGVRERRARGQSASPSSSGSPRRQHAGHERVRSAVTAQEHRRHAIDSGGHDHGQESGVGCSPRLHAGCRRLRAPSRSTRSRSQPGFGGFSTSTTDRLRPERKP